MKKRLITICFMLGLIVNSLVSQTVIWSENFEAGWGSWWADNGVWDVGVPTSGPEATHSGIHCAGTILDGNYPNDANTRLISPTISLPAVTGDETISLKFWQWFDIENDDDQIFLQISENY